MALFYLTLLIFTNELRVLYVKKKLQLTNTSVWNKIIIDAKQRLLILGELT